MANFRVSSRRQPISYIDIRSMVLRTENSEDVTICYFPSVGTADWPNRACARELSLCAAIISLIATYISCN